jgi:hypothetical protein
VSYRRLAQTLFRIDAMLDDRPRCARPDCWADALTWVAEGGRQDHPLPLQLPIELTTAEEQAVRDQLAAAMRRRALEQQIADQANRPYSDLTATPWDDPEALGAVIASERARREADPHVAHALALGRALDGIEAAEAAKPRPRPRPPWWRRWLRRG